MIFLRQVSAIRVSVVALGDQLAVLVQIVALFNSLTVAVDVVATIDGAAMLVDVVLALVWSDRVAVGMAVDQDFVVVVIIELMTVRAIAMGDWLDLMSVRMLMDDFSLV